MINVGDLVSLSGYFEVMDKNDDGEFIVDINGVLMTIPEHLLLEAPKEEV